MATLYVESISDDLYEALRQRARAARKSIAQEVIEMLEKFVPTPEELAKRRRFVEMARGLSTRAPDSTAAFPSSEEMLRDDRAR